jgi:hypothetical protein
LSFKMFRGLRTDRSLFRYPRRERWSSLSHRRPVAIGDAANYA